MDTESSHTLMVQTASSCESILLKLEEEFPFLKEYPPWERFKFFQQTDSVYRIKAGNAIINIDHTRLWYLKQRNSVIYTSFLAKQKMGAKNWNTFDMGDPDAGISPIVLVFFVYLMDTSSNIFDETHNCTTYKDEFEILSLLHKYDSELFEMCWSQIIRSFDRTDIVTLELEREAFPDFCRLSDLYGKIINPHVLSNYLYYLPYESLELPDDKRIFVDPYEKEWMIINTLLWKSKDTAELIKIGELRREESNMRNMLYEEQIENKLTGSSSYHIGQHTISENRGEYIM
jgi:hypothetical protein